MPVVEKKSLLKDKASVPEQPEITETVVLPDLLVPPESISDAPSLMPEPKPDVTKRVSPSRRSRKVRPAPTRPSPDQRKKSLENSITSIRNIMSKPKSSESTGDEGKAEELKMWNQLLNSLEKEHKEIENIPESNPNEDLPKE